MNLDGFIVQDSTTTSKNLPTLRFSGYTISLNRSSRRLLNDPDFVDIYVNPETQQMIITTAAEDISGFRVSNGRAEGVISCIHVMRKLGHPIGRVQATFQDGMLIVDIPKEQA